MKKPLIPCPDQWFWQRWDISLVVRFAPYGNRQILRVLSIFIDHNAVFRRWIYHAVFSLCNFFDLGYLGRLYYLAVQRIDLSLQIFVFLYQHIICMLDAGCISAESYKDKNCENDG